MLGWFKVGDGAGFALEPFAESFRGNLDSNIAAEARVARAVDFAHAALADGLQDFVRTESLAYRKRHLVKRV